MREYKLKMLIKTKHLQVYLENEFAIGIDFVSGIFAINLMFLKINIF